MWAWEECVFPCWWVECSIWSKAIKSPIVFLILCFDDISVTVSRVLKSLIIIVLLSISPFLSISIWLIHFGVPMLSVYILITVFFLLMNWPLYHYIMTLTLATIFDLDNFFCLIKVHLYTFSCSLFIYTKFFLTSIHFQPMYVLRAEMNLL